MDDLLSVDQAAAALGITRRGVLHRIAAGTLHAERIGARVLVIHRAELERHRAQGVRPGPRPKPRATGPLKRGRKGPGS